jgi:hypothetical protein
VAGSAKARRPHWRPHWHRGRSLCRWRRHQRREEVVKARPLAGKHRCGRGSGSWVNVVPGGGEHSGPGEGVLWSRLGCCYSHLLARQEEGRLDLRQSQAICLDRLVHGPGLRLLGRQGCMARWALRAVLSTVAILACCAIVCCNREGLVDAALRAGQFLSSMQAPMQIHFAVAGLQLQQSRCSVLGILRAAASCCHCYCVDWQSYCGCCWCCGKERGIGCEVHPCDDSALSATEPHLLGWRCVQQTAAAIAAAYAAAAAQAPRGIAAGMRQLCSPIARMCRSGTRPQAPLR